MSYKVFAVIISAAMLCTMLAGCKDKAGDMNKNSLTIGTATTETASAATGEAAQGNGVNTNPAINGYTDEDLEKMDKSALDTLKDPEPTPEPNTMHIRKIKSSKHSKSIYRHLLWGDGISVCCLHKRKEL